jgi:HemY protein
MIRIILLLIFLVVGLIAGPNLVGEKGYVLIALKNTTIEMSVISLGIMVFIAVIGFLVLEWAIKRIVGAITGSRHWLGGWGERRRQRYFTTGMQALAEGDLTVAQKFLGKTANANFDGLNLLALADVEAKQGNTVKALGYWQQASLIKGSELAAKLNMARFEIGQNNGVEALAIIESLSLQQKQKPNVIEIWAGALAAAGEWHTLRERLERGWKKPLRERYAHWAELASQADFAAIANTSGANELMQEWQKLPRGYKKDIAHQKAYIEQLIEQGMHQEAEKALVTAQKSGPHDTLLPLFKSLQLPKPIASIKLIEKWIKKDTQNAVLYSTLAHVAFHSGDEVLAEKALHQALELDKRQQDILLLAEIKAQQANSDEALALYKQGLSAG